MKIHRVVFSVLIASAIGFSPNQADAATVRSSSSYGLQFDTIGAAGGAMSSASYAQPQTLAGQNVIWDQYASSSYGFQPTGVFLIPHQGSAVRFWQRY